MSWVLAIALALAAFAATVFLFRVPRGAWTTLLAALALGLAGYSFQASPALPGAPTAPPSAEETGGWALIEMRRSFFGGPQPGDRLLVADALARQGQYVNAAAMLRGAVRENPEDAEAWTALGNALVETARGALGPAALFAYGRADDAAPGNLAPDFFIGAALIRQGEFLEGRRVWATALEEAEEDAPGREQIEQRLDVLDELLRRIVESRSEAAE